MGFYGGSNFRYYGIQSLLHFGALGLSKGSLVFIATCSVRSNCLLILVSCVL